MLLLLNLITVPSRIVLKYEDCDSNEPYNYFIYNTLEIIGFAFMRSSYQIIAGERVIVIDYNEQQI